MPLLLTALDNTISRHIRIVDLLDKKIMDNTYLYKTVRVTQNLT